MNSSSPVLRDLVLVGGGHSHVGVLRMWGMKPEPGVRLTLICTDTHTPYSGMLPGYIAGHYSFDECHIDLARLARFAGARFIHARAIGLDRANRRVMLEGRPPLAYDRVSINIGSTPQMRMPEGASELAIGVKPIAQFNQRWLQLLERVRQSRQRMTVAVIGGGAGGVEMLLAMQYRLRLELRALGRNPENLQFVLITSSSEVLPTHNARVRAHFARTLRERNVQVHTQTEVVQVSPGCVHTADGRTLDADETLWVTQAGGASWLHSTGLALNEDGFIEVQASLQSVTDPNVFAAGDVAHLGAQPLEKAGVFAVRMGPVLARNLRLSLQGKALRPYRPQRRWLALISTGARHAVGSRGGLYFQGEWAWRYKNWIDQRFMRRFSPDGMTPKVQAATHALALETHEQAQALSAQAMRCGGCGAKVGPDVLTGLLARLQTVQRSDVLLGLADGDDAALLRVPAGKVLAHSVDFFRAFIHDPYVFGQIAAVHALGDLYAMGAEPQSATAIATVPAGLDAKVQDDLLQMMSGALSVLNEARCALVGGHTGEGQELALGFAVNGLIDDKPSAVLGKSGLVAGQVLILTKPLGTGCLLAAHERGQARGRWVDAALASMRTSGAEPSRILRAHGASACTDVTGFGLIGHGLELARASGVDIEFDLSALPVLDGALETLRAGVRSSLHGANERLAGALATGTAHADDPRYPLLFDPQTAGGLLAGVPAEQAPACLLALHEAGHEAACVIGRVLPPGPQPEPLHLVRGSRLA